MMGPAWMRTACYGSSFPLALTATLSVEPLVQDDSEVPRPNLLVVLLDDVGLDQLACYDDENPYTDPKGFAYAHLPNVDALAARGVRFTQCRTMPVCSPSRASILSGLYPFRHGVGRSVYAEYATAGFREFATAPAPRPVIAPERLGAAGYTTAAIGKWHLALEPSEGGTLDSHPTDLGFDEWRGPPRNLMDPGSPAKTDGVPKGYYNYWWVEDGERAQVVGEHASARTVARARDWIESAPGPWFAYVAFNACHAPLGGGSWPKADHGFGGPCSVEWRNTRVRATLEHLDVQLGALFEAAGEDTVIVLLSDNGTGSGAFRVPADEPRYPSGHPLHEPGDEDAALDVAPLTPGRSKKTVWETGVRVPLIVAGPGIAAPGRTSDALVDTVDLLPTLLALAGAPEMETTEEAGIDGVDFSTVLLDANANGPRDYSFTEFFYPNGVADPTRRKVQDRAYVRRDGPHLWKVIETVWRRRGQRADSYLFFDVAADPLEERELGTEHPAYGKTRAALAALVGDGE